MQTRHTYICSRVLLIFMTALMLMTCCQGVSDNIIDVQFEQVLSGSAQCPASSLLTEVTARSDIECATVCSGIPACKSYSCAVAGGNCLMSGRNNCSLQTTGIATFRKIGIEPVLTTPATILLSCGAPITCPLVTGAAAMFMQRIVGNVNFSRPWADYDAGFGDCSTDFWLGLRNISALLGSGGATWRVEMTLWTDVTVYVEYTGFTVGNSSTNYLMSYTAMGSKSAQVTAYGMSNNNNNGFSTFDRDNDKYGTSCTQTYNGQGGFWLGSCGRAFPTAAFPTAATTSFGNMICDFSGSYTSIRQIRMYLKR